MFQDSSFVVAHLQGCGVEALLGLVEGQDDLKPILMLLKPEGRPWQKLFLDAGLGFWQEWPDLDLSDYGDDSTCRRVDYMDLFSLQSATIREIVCEPVGEDLASRILLRLSSGELELRPEDPAVLDSPSVVSWNSR